MFGLKFYLLDRLASNTDHLEDYTIGTNKNDLCILINKILCIWIYYLITNPCILVLTKLLGNILSFELKKKLLMQNISNHG